MTEPPQNVDEVAERLREIQSRKRGGLRWNVSKHTAELAIGALGVERPKPLGKTAKSRRRKRSKRLL